MTRRYDDDGATSPGSISTTLVDDDNDDASAGVCVCVVINDDTMARSWANSRRENSRSAASSRSNARVRSVDRINSLRVNTICHACVNDAHRLLTM